MTLMAVRGRDLDEQVCFVSSYDAPHQAVTQQDGPYQLLQAEAGTMLPNCELNRLLFFINYPVCGVQFEQDKNGL